MKNKILAVILSVALLISCFAIFSVTAADVIGDTVVTPGETLWSFDGTKVSSVPEGWELEKGNGGNFWGTAGTSSLTYNASSSAVRATAGSCDGVLYFSEIEGDAANFIYEVTFTHAEADSSLGLANNITVSSTDTDGDGLYDASGATWFALYEASSSTAEDGYYIRKGSANTISRTIITTPEDYTRSAKGTTSTYKMVVVNGVTYMYANGHFLGSFTDSNTVKGANIRVGMFLTSTAVDIKFASVKAIDGSKIIWDKTTKQPTVDSDSDGFIDISQPSELAWVINAGGAADGKWELMNDIWLNDMLVTVTDGVPTVTKMTDGSEITDLSSLNTWYVSKTVKGEFKGNGNVVNGLFYDSYSETVSENTRALFPNAGAGLTVSGIGVENSYITSNSSYRTAALIGNVTRVSGSIDSCYAGESVYMYGDNLAGIIGGGTCEGGHSFNVSNCYSLATLKHHDDNPKDTYGTYIVNAIIGNNWSWNDCTITNCYAVGDTKITRSGTATNCTIISTANASTIKGLAAARVITKLGDAFVTTEDGYPTLKIFLDEINDFENIPLDGGYKKGSGTATDPFIIETAAQLRLAVGTFGESGKYYKLANDIYVNEINNITWSTGTVRGDYEPNVWFGSKTADDGRSYTGFGDVESTFTGHIDGDGYAVYGIYYRPYSGYDLEKYGKFSTCAGLVPAFNSGSISNLTIKNSYFATGRFAGAISADTNAQVLITNVAVDETVTIAGTNSGVLNSYGKNYESSAIGGFIGYIRNKNNTTLTNCGFAGLVTKSGIGHVWGLVGTSYNSKYTLNNCFSVGMAPLCSSTKGVHGNARNITVSNVYSTVAPTDWNTDSTLGTVNGTVTVVEEVTGENALSDTNMANLDKTVWYAVKDNVKAPMLRIYGTNIGDVDENGKGTERSDETALRQTLIGAQNYMNTDYNRDDESNICDLVAMNAEISAVEDDWRSHPEDFKLLALTFDDGPDDYSPSVTMQVADVLAENNGSGTFFFIGDSFNQANDPAVAKYVVTQGSEVANHSYTHSKAEVMDAMSDEDFAKEFEGANDLIKQHTGMTPKYWRGGGFAYSERVYEKLEEIGMPAIGSYIQVGSDYSGGTATVDGIVNILMNNLPDGAIIGAHSSSKTYVTPDALRIALPQLYAQGYRFCTLSELFEYKGVDYDDIPVHCYISRVETLDDGSTKIHTQKHLYLDNWKENPENYKLLAFTFDDGPRPAKDTRMVDLFAKYKGSATFFVTGTSCKNYGYESLQYAINNGWDIGNHSMTHADAYTGSVSAGTYTELTYDELKYQISDFYDLLEAKPTMADGVTPYEVSLYRPPQIRTTETMFEVCEEENMPVIWLSQNTYDWSGAYDDAARLKVMQDGIGTWIDGDVILGHITQDSTYNCLVETLDDFYDAGYRFCSITELMQYRGIERSDISGKLNNVDSNNGCVKNLVKSATYGKAE